MFDTKDAEQTVEKMNRLNHPGRPIGSKSKPKPKPPREPKHPMVDKGDHYEQTDGASKWLRDKKGKFMPGTKVDMGKMKRMSASKLAQKACVDHGLDVMEWYVCTALNEEHPINIRKACVDELSNRLYGKAAVHIENKVDFGDDHQITINLVGPDEERTKEIEGEVIEMERIQREEVRQLAHDEGVDIDEMLSPKEVELDDAMEG